MDVGEKQLPFDAKKALFEKEMRARYPFSIYFFPYYFYSYLEEMRTRYPLDGFKMCSLHDLESVL
jgi:hypothetical protein